MEKNLTVSVVIYNSDLILFRKMISSLFLFTPELKHLIIVNNGSENINEIKEVVDSFIRDNIEIQYILNSENLGYGKAHNQSFKNCKTEYFAVLNDDIEFFEIWSTPMIEELKKNEKLVQIGMQEGVCNTWNKNGDAYNSLIPDYVEGSCFIVKSKIIKSLGGLFDEEYKIAYWEDGDLSLRLRKKGFLIKTISLSWKHHRAVTSKKVESQLDLQGYHVINRKRFFSKWCNYIYAKKFGPFILLKRQASYGDVFLLTPIIRALKQKYTDCGIGVMTQCPDMLLYNNDIDVIFPMNIPVACDIFLDFDYAYEKDSTKSIFKSYLDVANLGNKISQTPILFLSDKDIFKIRTLIPFEKFIVIDVSDTWKAKKWSNSNLDIVAKKIREFNIKIVVAGQVLKNIPNITCDLNITNKLTLTEYAALIYSSSGLISHEGLPVHIAQATGKPVLAFYTCTLPHLVNDVTASNLYPVITEAVCRGCRHTKTGGTGVYCNRKYICTEMIDKNKVFFQLERMLKENKYILNSL